MRAALCTNVPREFVTDCAISRGAPRYKLSREPSIEAFSGNVRIGNRMHAEAFRPVTFGGDAAVDIFVAGP